jgi:hypothetical protein
MNARLLIVAASGLIVVAVFFGGLQSRATDVPRVDDVDHDDTAHQDAYATRLAANNAAAGRWHAAQPGGVADDEPSDDEQLIADNYGCPEGTQFWQRDSITPMCAALCSGDQDCGPDEGRCRILDVASRESAPEVLLVDDLTAEDVEYAQEPTVDETPVLMLCDPFWDIEGATDADVVLGTEAADVDLAE